MQIEIVHKHHHICIFLLEGTTEGIFDFADAFSDYGILLKLVFAKCWDYRQIAFNSDPIFICSENDLDRGEEQEAALGMEGVLRFSFLDPLVVDQPASLKNKAYFLFILEFNFFQVHGHLLFRRVVIFLDDFSGVNQCWSVFYSTEHLN